MKLNRYRLTAGDLISFSAIFPRLKEASYCLARRAGMSLWRSHRNMHVSSCRDRKQGKHACQDMLETAKKKRDGYVDLIDISVLWTYKSCTSPLGRVYTLTIYHKLADSRFNIFYCCPIRQLIISQRIACTTVLETVECAVAQSWWQQASPSFWNLQVWTVDAP